MSHTAAASDERLPGEGIHPFALDDFSDWSTEDLLAGLRRYGVDTDAERFRAQALAAGGPEEFGTACNAVADEHHPNVYSDFPWMAAWVLWYRLAPDDLTATGVRADLENALAWDPGSNQASFGAPVVSYWEAAQRLGRLLQQTPPHSRRDCFSHVDADGMYVHEEVLLDRFVVWAQECPTESLALLDLLEEATASPRFRLPRPLALAALGREAEARAAMTEALQENDAPFYGHMCAGAFEEALGNEAAAWDYWKSALECAAEDWEWEECERRLKPLAERTGRAADWEALRVANPPPKAVQEAEEKAQAAQQRAAAEAQRREPGLVRSQPPAFDALTQPKILPAQVRRLGRNDPCPCGSGKKYKICCLKSGKFK